MRTPAPNAGTSAVLRQRKATPNSKDHGANMGPTWVLSAPDGPHVGPMNLAIGDRIPQYFAGRNHPSPPETSASETKVLIEQIHAMYPYTIFSSRERLKCFYLHGAFLMTSLNWVIQFACCNVQGDIQHTWCSQSIDLEIWHELPHNEVVGGI